MARSQTKDAQVQSKKKTALAPIKKSPIVRSMKRSSNRPSKRRSPIPVTVLSGFLGAGKTTIMNALLVNLDRKKIAVIVNDMSAVNIDAKLITRKEEKMIELSNGCICCTLREDLLLQLQELSTDATLDCILIESTGISEPLHIAETFAYADSLGTDFSSRVKLDTMVTVVDLESFFKHYGSRSNETVTVAEVAEMSCDAATCSPEGEGDDEIEDDTEGGDKNTGETDEESVGPASPPTLCDLLVDQVQFADVIVLNKIDTAADNGLLLTAKATISHLNPHAVLLTCCHGEGVKPSDVIDTKLFSYDKAEKHSEWLAEDWENGALAPETEEYGVSTVTFEYSSRPFHPQRLYDFYEEVGYHNYNPSLESRETKSPGLGVLIRSKGFVWLATRHDNFCVMHQTGGSVSLQTGDKWWVTTDPSLWPKDDEYFNSELLPLLSPYGEDAKDTQPGKKRRKGKSAVPCAPPTTNSDGSPFYGDRSQLLVLIGLNMIVNKKQSRKKRKQDSVESEVSEEDAPILKRLKECLLTDEEMAMGPERWKTEFHDPFLNEDSAMN